MLGKWAGPGGVGEYGQRVDLVDRAAAINIAEWRVAIANDQAVAKRQLKSEIEAQCEQGIECRDVLAAIQIALQVLAGGEGGRGGSRLSHRCSRWRLADGCG